MIDNTLVQLSYAFLVVAGLASVVAVAAVAVALRDLRRAEAPVVTLIHSADLDVCRAA